MNASRLHTLLTAICISAALPACIPLVAAGVGGGVVASMDRRSYGIQLQDTEIEHRFNRSFPAALEAKSQASATSFNRWVLLTGQAIDEASKAEVEQVARKVPNVREVFNEITIGYPLSFSDRANDTLLTTKVKTRLVDNRDISAHSFKVVTDGGTVYLMGLVTEPEGNIATEIARTTSGVKRVVKVLEVLSAAEIANLSATAPQPAPATSAKP